MSGFPQDSIDQIAENLSRNEVHYCVSALVYDLRGRYETEADELRDVTVKDNWVDAAFEYAANELDASPEMRAQLIEYINDNDLYLFDDVVAHLSARTLADIVSENEETAREFCEHFDVDPLQDEADEHWIVADRLADDLEACGGMVLRDWHGLTIWGRTTTGQAIAMDGIMRRVAELVKARA